MTAAALFSQTQVRPAQIKNWRQVSPSELVGTTPLGTSIRLSQISIQPDVVAVWKEIIDSSARGDAFGIAWKPDQPAPILLCCGNASAGWSPATFAGFTWFVK